MTTVEVAPDRILLAQRVQQALSEVTDPELDQPITELGFVRTIELDDDGVTVHLRLPTAFCSPNFAYLMAADSLDALRDVEGIGQVRVLLDDHHDSDKINSGLAADAGYLGTFGVEADRDLDGLRRTFLRKAHSAAMERAVSDHMRRTGTGPEDLYRLTLHDLVRGPLKAALLRRRVAIGLDACPACRVLVDETGRPLSADEIPLRLRFARSVRISMEGNAHFCRGLLATRYADDDVSAEPHVTDRRTHGSNR